jgi:aspartate/methionine/tyrosine aminotransferase
MRALMNRLYQQMKISIFERMSLAAAKHCAVNLGQGFPDFGWPEDILDAASRALKEESVRALARTAGAARSRREAL